MGTNFVFMVLEIPDNLPFTQISLQDLPDDWKLESHYAETQPIGSAWYQAGKTLGLQVPSAVVPSENNYVLKTRHPDFAQVQVKHKEPFRYDYRFVTTDKALGMGKK